MPGNGDGKITVVFTKFPPDGLRLEAQIGPATRLQDIPAAINCELATWLEHNPDLRIRTTLPILEHGTTVAIYLWFDR